jgi:hypothetical protein
MGTFLIFLHIRFVPEFLHFVKKPFTFARHVPKLEPMKFDFEKFYQAVNARRTARSASWRQVAREIGIGKSTLARMAQNKRPDADGLAALSYWAEVNPADFVRHDPPASVASRNVGEDSAQHANGAVSAC